MVKSIRYYVHVIVLFLTKFTYKHEPCLAWILDIASLNEGGSVGHFCLREKEITEILQALLKRI